MLIPHILGAPKQVTAQEQPPGFISIQKRRAFEFRVLSIGICDRPPERTRNDKSAQPGGLKQTGLRGLSNPCDRGTVAHHSHWRAGPWRRKPRGQRPGPHPPPRRSCPTV